MTGAMATGSRVGVQLLDDRIKLAAPICGGVGSLQTFMEQAQQKVAVKAVELIAAAQRLHLPQRSDKGDFLYGIKEKAPTMADAEIGHEATVSKVGEDQLFYLMSRGLPEDAARKAIERALKSHSGNLSDVARQLGIGRSTLYRKLKEYGLK